MKKILYSLLACMAFLLSCETVLDKVPLDMITDVTVWDDQGLCDAYLAGQQANMYILTKESPTMRGANEWTDHVLIDLISDECAEGSGWGDITTGGKKFGNLTETGGLLEWWEDAYKVNRALNIFIEKLQTSTVYEDYKKKRIAEARFLRAYNYFSLVKRYGGVPLITEAQNLNDSYEELYRSRDSEKTIYDFVISECDDIVDDLPAAWPSSDYGRATKDAAMALKCRAALYAGSIAQFGTQQLNGLLGFPSSDAQGYYQKSYDAAKDIMQRDIAKLYNRDPSDKVKNFIDLFLVERNPEAIWVRQFNSTESEFGGNGWAVNFFQSPGPNAWGGSGLNNPYLEMADEFENVNTGTPGQAAPLDRNVIQQGLWSGPDLFEGKEPRFWASVYGIGKVWQGITWSPYRGLIKPDGTILESGSYEGTPAIGTPTNWWNRTGFGVLKYCDESTSISGGRSVSPTDWQIFRYGEVLLNFTEAAYELGKTDEALSAINQIRDRAGVAPLTSLDRDKIRHERKVELAFEGHRYWDLRRWRTAVTMLTKDFSGLRFQLDYLTGKYKLTVIEKFDGVTRTPIFYERNYYFPITPNRRGNNPNLVENPGYSE